jgi:alpha-L-fucosidase 2
VLNSGGSLSVNGTTIAFKDCDSLTLIVGAGTDYVMDSKRKFRGDAPDGKVSPKTRTASAIAYEKLRDDHIKDFHSLFNRVDIDLGQSSDQQNSLPTDKRKVQATDKFDPDLEELLFQLGRYFMISASRGFLPANLQVSVTIELF